MLECVVVVMVSLTAGEDRHDGAITSTVFGVIWTLSDSVAEGVNEECAVLNDNDA